MSLDFCFIGAGNLATHLATVLNDKAGNVVQIYSRTENSAKTLADKLGCAYTTTTDEITSDADIYFVALKDSAVSEVLSGKYLKNKLLVHCSGSLSMAFLESYAEHIGVFYPLQTFSKNREVDFADIPVFVEADSAENQEMLLQIAHQITSSVQVLDSERRKCLHIAAVFACNFTNHLYALASDYLENNGISFEVLKPLVLETAKKVQEMPPFDAQTGPAIRYDENIISKHLSDLEAFPELKELYGSISKSIFEHHQKKQ